MSTRCLTLIVAISAALGGCAAQTTVAGMTLSQAEAVKPSNPRMSKAVAVKAVGGGEDADPLGGFNVTTGDFKQALLDSLKLAGLLGDAAAPYSLMVISVKLDQPSFGFDISVTATVHYVVTDTAKGGVVWSETITSSHTATMDDAFVGVTRLTLASEGAIRKNIGQLVQKLGAAPLPGRLGVKELARPPGAS
jgi:hypothetical protein